MVLVYLQKKNFNLPLTDKLTNERILKCYVRTKKLVNSLCRFCYFPPCRYIQNIKLGDGWNIPRILRNFHIFVNLDDSTVHERWKMFYCLLSQTLKFQSNNGGSRLKTGTVYVAMCACSFASGIKLSPRQLSLILHSSRW
jgi:hypothetical protein